MKNVLIDVDDTLFDFKECAKSTLKKCCEEQNIKFTDEFYTSFLKSDREIWDKYEKGEVTQAYIFENRFAILFKKFGIDKDSSLFEKNFEKYYALSCDWVVGAQDMVEYLKLGYNLYIASNSVRECQISRLKKAGIYNYFNDFFVSDEIGACKPSIEFFNNCFEKIEGFLPEETIIIGDSLTSDMQGGYKSGIKTCWYNAKNQQNTLNIPCDYEIHDFAELKNIL